MFSDTVQKRLHKIEQYRSAFSNAAYDEIPKRRHPEPFHPFFDEPFEQDCSKILGSHAFTRLPRKAQVYLNPRNPHTGTRLSHTIDILVKAAAAKFLGLNDKLCIAAALDHDTGHWPLGHLGEKIGTEIWQSRGNEGKVKHAVCSVILAQKIEPPEGIGLNLTYPTLECVLQHSTGAADIRANPNACPEYALMMYLDKIAYTFKDLPDTLNRIGGVTPESLPDCFDFKRMSPEDLAMQCICSLIEESAEAGYISFEKCGAAEAFKELKNWMYENVYKKADKPLHEAYLREVHHFFDNDSRFDDCDPLVLLSLLTDTQTLSLGNQLNYPHVSDDFLQEYGITELVPYVRGKEIDLTDPDLHEKDFVY